VGSCPVFCCEGSCKLLGDLDEAKWNRVQDERFTRRGGERVGWKLKAEEDEEGVRVQT